jgi:hypothetical protein
VGKDANKKHPSRKEGKPTRANESLSTLKTLNSLFILLYPVLARMLMIIHINVIPIAAGLYGKTSASKCG